MPIDKELAMGHGMRLRVKSILAGSAVGVIVALGGLTVVAAPASATTTPTTLCGSYGAPPCSAPVSSITGTASDGGTPVASTGSLAFTGTDVAITASVGAGAIAAGGMIVLASRRRRTQV
jgi:hypothetical protein